MRAGSAGDQRVLRAPLHEGGEIDWFTFDVDREARLFLNEEENAARRGKRAQRHGDAVAFYRHASGSLLAI